MTKTSLAACDITLFQRDSVGRGWLLLKGERDWGLGGGVINASLFLLKKTWCLDMDMRIDLGLVVLEVVELWINPVPYIKICIPVQAQ